MELPLIPLRPVSAAFDDLPNGEGLGDLAPLEPLQTALARIDAQFRIDRILAEAEADRSQNRIRRYYTASGLGYRAVHSRAGCMHLALTRGNGVSPADHYVQAEAVGRIIRATRARRVLELGCGRGFNLRQLAHAFPDVDFSGIDLMPGHIRAARRVARSLTNLTCLEGSFDALPPELGQFDVIFAIEALCHAPNLDFTVDAVARHLSPGGSIVIFDAVRTAPLNRMSAGMATSVRIYEAVVAVTAGFRTHDALTGALARTGLVPQELRDVTRGVWADARRLHGYGLRYFSRADIRMATAWMPETLRRNACGALLSPYLVEGATPGHPAEAGTTRDAGLAYLSLWFRKP